VEHHQQAEAQRQVGVLLLSNEGEITMKKIISFILLSVALCAPMAAAELERKTFTLVNSLTRLGKPYPKMEQNLLNQAVQEVLSPQCG